jgi:hydroxypyruvate reductase
VEAAFQTDLVNQVHLIDMNERNNALTSEGSSSIWFYIETVLNPSLEELRRMAAHETLHQLVYRPEPAAGPLPPAEAWLIGSNRLSLDAMPAAAPGARIASDRLTGAVTRAADKIIAAARRARPGAVLLFGGETTVRITGDGLGGRNQELALRVALLGRDLPFDWCFLSAGTDGRDGPTDAAGGLVDHTSARRMRALGLDAFQALSRSDSYHALQASGDLLVTGATGTNVADLQIFLKA